MRWRCRCCSCIAINGRGLHFSAFHFWIGTWGSLLFVRGNAVATFWISLLFVRGNAVATFWISLLSVRGNAVATFWIGTWGSLLSGSVLNIALSPGRQKLGPICLVPSPSSTFYFLSILSIVLFLGWQNSGPVFLIVLFSLSPSFLCRRHIIATCYA